MTPAADAVRQAILREVAPGGRIAVGDGAGAPVEVLPGIAAAAAELGDLEVVCGWCLGDGWDVLDHPAIRLTTFMGGYAMRPLLARTNARYLPLRLGSLPGAFHGALRSDLVIASGHHIDGRWAPGTEICWVPTAVEAGARLVVVERPGLPRGAAPYRDAEAALMVTGSQDHAHQAVEPPIDDISMAVGERVVSLLPEGATIQYGPGAIGRGVLAAVRSPVRVWSGVITDAVVDLDERHLLAEGTVATYAVGTQRLYEWMTHREVLVRVENSHDVTALAREGIWAVNTALEIDLTGQVNVERIKDDVIAGVGGHADFAMAGARAPRGASIIAIPSHRGSKPTLVERLDGPTSTSRSDVDFVVTESGVADLRGLDDRARARSLARLWGW